MDQGIFQNMAKIVWKRFQEQVDQYCRQYLIDLCHRKYICIVGYALSAVNNKILEII